MFRNLPFFRKKRDDEETEFKAAALFKRRYDNFRQLLESNSELLKIIAELQEKLDGETVFGMSHLVSQSSRALFHTARMVKNFNELSKNAHPDLNLVLQGVKDKVNALIRNEQSQVKGEFVLPYGRVGKEMVDQVGGKNANLGEMLNGAGLPIPRGFAITTAAYWAFVRGGCLEEIKKRAMDIDPADPASISAASEDIQRLFITQDMSEELAAAILGAYADLCRACGCEEGVAIAMRSSAVGEDSELSFAGQYRTILNVPPDRVLSSYKLIAASLFTPRAISYRLFKGIPLEDAVMSVACLEMVESKASGVMYTRHPFDPADDTLHIDAVWGLGPYAVDGVVSPDAYTFSKGSPPRLLKRELAAKTVRLVGREGGVLAEEAVSPEEQTAPCLSEDQARTLAEYGLRLEAHYRTPQDVEWALDAKDKLILLQTRPLHAGRAQAGSQMTPAVPGYEIVLEGGDIACPGVGSGPAHVVRSEMDLENFPENGVLVAAHSSPKYVIVLQKAQAVLTDAGSATGHMAALAREFGVPALFNAKHATARITPGERVTVDAGSRRVYRGEVPEALAQRRVKEGVMKGTPVYAILQALAEVIVPLRLIDPKSPDFKAGKCATVHDLMRFMHELSYGEMFQISDLTTGKGRFSLKLDAHLPLDLYIIDLGEGIKDLTPKARKVKPAQIMSVPFLALLKGLLDPRLSHREPKPLNLGGFFSVMSEQMLAPPDAGGQRFGDKSYAIISDKYLNFSSRVGYHYSVLDAYCGLTVSKNYVNFEFKGGAADELRRNRRVRSIALILENLGFGVEVTADRCVARFQKYEADVIKDKLDQVGRLLQFTRQMDMLMNTEASVEKVAASFLEERYDYGL